MPKDISIKKVLVIGSGPIVIGQAAEFDYSGTQACQTLKEEGIEVILINSNPATIMTDKHIANKTYIEPITIEVLEKIIEKERPDSLLAGMGGQTGLNMSIELYEKGILDKYNVRVIGTSIDSIKKGEDRELFRNMMNEIKQPIINSTIVNNLDEGLNWAKSNGYPVIVRPAYTLGGTGGGIAENETELIKILNSGLSLSSINQVLLEKSVKGWKEIEYEVIRDKNSNCITVCNMENIDPVGIHTGDSIVVAPTQTLSEFECSILKKASFDILNAVGIEGGCNIQFAVNPNTIGEYAVIEINPRVSRSSALASKATGYPIAKVATKIALGYTLDEIINSVTKTNFACTEPTIDYVVIKIPKWPFDKFFHADRKLGTKMMATGEIMSIGNNFESAFLKGIRSLEINAFSLEFEKFKNLSLSELKEKITTPDDERIFAISEMIRRNYKMEMIYQITGIDIFFLEKLKNIIEEEKKLQNSNISDLNKDWLKKLKKNGFSDKAIAKMLKSDVNQILMLRNIWNIKPSYKMVDTCAGEFDAISPYYYSTYSDYDEVKVSDKKKVIVIGSGPIRIGQGIEFDYASVHCAIALKNLGIETIIINNNPETVSTDFNISDKLYFEPLTEEDVYEIIQKENPDGVILQFGGQTAIKLAKFLKEKNICIYGTNFEQINLAEDRELFDKLLETLDIKRPKGKAVLSVQEGLDESEKIGFPILVRPSYVLGGQGMEITYSKSELSYYLEEALKKDSKNPILIDKYINGKEIEVDAICDGDDVLIPGIMEHLERAGVHSGDSISIYPSKNISEKIKLQILNHTEKIAKSIGVIGMINIQFICKEDEVYIIEVNPRASRTVPFISKVTNIPIVSLATKVMFGEKLKNLGYGIGIYKESDIFSVKVPVFSTQKLPNVEITLGPEMKSTGEVLGLGKTFEEALFKGFVASNMFTKTKGNKILATIKDSDKEEFLLIAKELHCLGFSFIATEGTAKILIQNNIDCETIGRINERKPNILDLISNKEINLLVNTPTKGNDSKRDGFTLRRAAIERNIDVITSLDTLKALADVEKNKFNINEINIYSI